MLDRYSKTVGKRSEVDKIMTIPLILQRIFGHQILDPDWTWKKFYKHQIFFFTIVIYVFFGTLDVMKNTTDVEIIAEASYTLTLIITCPIKLFLFINNRFVFRKLYLAAKTNIFDSVKENSIEEAEKVLLKGNRVVFALLGMVVLPVSIYELTTLWNYVNGRRVLLSQSTATLMPMAFPYYEAAWLFHSIFMIEISSIVIVMDMWFVFLLFFFCVSCENLIKVLQVDPEDHEESNFLYSQRLSDSLKKFYSFHVKQSRYLNNVNKMYKWLAIIPLCNAAMCICIVILIMSKELNWRFAPHIVPLFTEVFVYSWFGEQIKTKTNEVRIALKDFDWMHLKEKDKKKYLIIISYMNKDFGIKIANGSNLSLRTMTEVLNGSYRAYTVLQSTET